MIVNRDSEILNSFFRSCFFYIWT